jgi:hypothetical protein
MQSVPIVVVRYHGKKTICKLSIDLVGFIVTFNNISVISWQSVLLVDETVVPEENHQPVARYVGA